jgi:hypothetical protein
MVLEEKDARTRAVVVQETEEPNRASRAFRTKWEHD